VIITGRIARSGGLEAQKNVRESDPFVRVTVIAIAHLLVIDQEPIQLLPGHRLADPNGARPCSWPLHHGPHAMPPCLLLLALTMAWSLAVWGSGDRAVIWFSPFRLRGAGLYMQEKEDH